MLVEKVLEKGTIGKRIHMNTRELFVMKDFQMELLSLVHKINAGQGDLPKRDIVTTHWRESWRNMIHLNNFLTKIVNDVESKTSAEINLFNK